MRFTPPCLLAGCCLLGRRPPTSSSSSSLYPSYPTIETLLFVGTDRSFVELGTIRAMAKGDSFRSCRESHTPSDR
jgi:hypothetical protein